MWISTISTYKMSGWYHDDQRAFAIEHAGIDIDLKDPLYGIHIGQYDNIITYNDDLLYQYIKKSISSNIPSLKKICITRFIFLHSR